MKASAFPGHITGPSRSSRIKVIASSLLFQSTALAGSLASLGVPLYSRAYAQATCSPSSTNGYVNDGDKIKTTIFTCTIASDSTVTSPQYAYGGALTFYRKEYVYYRRQGMTLAPLTGQPGLTITLTNQATIDVTAAADTTSMIGMPTPSYDTLNYYRRSQSNAIGVISIGSNGHNTDKGKDPPPGGAGGTVIITNSGEILDAAGAGIYAASLGGSTYDVGDGGTAGAVTVTSTAAVTARGFGIVAMNRAGASSFITTGGDSGDVTIVVSGSVASTSSGAGVFAASYGGNSPNNSNYFGSDGGKGGNAGNVTVTVGSSATPFDKSITTTAAGTIGKRWRDVERKSGAAVSAISYGGWGIVGEEANGYDGGDAGTATVTISGTGDTLLKTSGDDSVAVFAMSYGGTSADDYDASKSGGTASTVTVTMTGGGTIETAGASSSGIAAQSLGGLGNITSSASSTSASKGGVAGAVTVTNDFAITTQGDHSHGIAAISAGAGGGEFTWTGSESFEWGDGNPASNTSGAVSVTNTAAITTYGVDSHGIIAQSIGGGGGVLTSTAALSTDSYGAVDSKASQKVGGFSGSAHGAAVTVVNHGTIVTHGGYAADGSDSDGSNVELGGGIAIIAQSIGGGGGINSGGGALGSFGGGGKSTGSGSNGDTASVQNYAALTTYGSEAHGIVVQSIGGGGGGGRNKKGFFVAVGGEGGPGGAGGTAEVTNDAAITVSGDYANGIVAQSIGGGGGAGGRASAWGIGLSGAIGGFGGNGGDGGKATVTTSSTSVVTTSGTKGTGVYVQSIGGGGGTGGAAKSASVGTGFDFAFAQGGSGGSGGKGGEAYIKHEGSITTSGADALGVVVQSIGGGGGGGGASLAHSLALGIPIDPKGDSFAISMAVSQGGSGGSGGAGGEAKAILERGSKVATAGDGASGLFVQSIGGGGGAGGDSTAASGTATLASLLGTLTDGQVDLESTNVTLNLNLSLGGSGGDGGAGGTAYAHGLGSIVTTGDFADAILVQSIGGGGGAGGSGEADSVSNLGDSKFALSFVFGGSADGGGAGGTATGGVAGTGKASTAGSNAIGLVVQSIGGGGGKGGSGSGDVDADTTVTIGMGATGGKGGAGGEVYAWNNGSIVTTGDASHGIVAQSVGGGGGIGGSGTSSISHAFEFKAKAGYDFKDWIKAHPTAGMDVKLSAQSGSAGGDGGDGGQVVVGTEKLGEPISTGTTTTSGAFSHGIVAQSIGGGGGLAGVSSSANDVDVDDDLPHPDVDLDITTIGMGMTSGGAGNGGAVTVYANSVRTYGFGASGVIAQSIGGGGGLTVSSGYAMDKVYATFGSVSDGYGRFNGGAVTVSTADTTTIVTSGDNANGIVAQSFGAGGGFAGVALGTYSAVHDDTLSDVIDVTLGAALDIGFTMPANGDAVSVTHANSIRTSGARAVGVVAQSIGGGGAFLSASTANIASTQMRKEGWASGGGDVQVTLDQGASIVTSGDGAVGILAQSIGGGGGVAADLNSRLYAYPGFDKSTDGSNYYYRFPFPTETKGATVTVEAGAAVTTSGSYAHGILVQSLVGGGGIFQRNGKTYGTWVNRGLGYGKNDGLTVSVSGSVTVKADNAWAIWAQANDFAESNAGTLAITVASGGSVTGSTATGAIGGAIYAYGGRYTTISIDNTQYVTGNVVTKTQAPYDIASAARVSGSAAVAAAPAGSVFRNHGTGTLVTGGIVDVDSVLNAGTIDIGGAGQQIQTVFTGDLVGVESADLAGTGPTASAMQPRFTPVSYYSGGQKEVWRDETSSQGGLLSALDVDMEGGTNDRIVVEGDFTGDWGVLLNAHSLLPNARVDFLKVEGAQAADLAVLPTAVFQFSEPTASTSGWTGFSVEAADFGGGGAALSDNDAAVAGALQSAWDRLARGEASATAVDSGPTIGQAFAAFHDATSESLDGYLSSLSSQTALAPLANATESAMLAAASVLSCPAFTSGAQLREVDCVWGRGLGGYTDRDQGHGADGFSATTSGVQIGGQKALEDGWFVGGGVAYETTSYDGNGRSERMDARTASAAVAVKKQVGPWLLGAVVGGGYTWGDSTRQIQAGGLRAVAEASPKSSYVFGRTRAAYQIALDERVYLRPMVDLDAVTVRQESYKEHGAGALNLSVDGSTKTFFGVTPGAEVGARLELSDDLRGRVFGGLGVSFLSDDQWDSEARFAGVSSSDSFTTSVPVSDKVGRVTLGLDLQQIDGLEVKLQYDGAFADGYRYHGGSIRFGYKF